MAYGFNEDKSKYDIQELLDKMATFEQQLEEMSGNMESVSGIVTSLSEGLDSANDALGLIGKHYSAYKSVAITSANINSYAEGPSLTLPAGTYVITGVWLFNSASGARTMETRLRWGTGNHAEGQRIAAPNGNYARLNCAWTGRLASDTTVTLIGSATVTSTAQTCYLNATRIK